MAIDFPFVGAGDANYFEWAEVLVRFERELDAAERKRVEEDVPPPIAGLKWTGALLSAGSEQGVGRQIRAAYSSKKKGEAKALGMQNRFAAAGATANARFNAHIEAWLRAANQVVPVLVAYRRQDLEAGGTSLSAWHHESMKQLPRVLEVLAKEARGEDAGLGARLLRWAEADQVVIGAKTKHALASMEKAAAEREEAEREARDAKRATERAANIAALDAAAEEGRRTPLSPKEIETGLKALEAHLPALAKRLRRIDPGELVLFAGATKKAIDATERELGHVLVPEHRALLEVFDGGRVGGITIAGTHAGGARGRDELVALSRMYATSSRGSGLFATTVAIEGAKILQARMSKTTDAFLQEGINGRLLKTSRKLDTVFVELLKASGR